MSDTKTCLTCRYRRTLNEMPDAALFRCIRFPHHEIIPNDRMDSHTCGEYDTLPLEQLARWMITHGH